MDKLVEVIKKDSKFFFGSDVPTKKLNNAIKSYAPTVSRENVYVLFDDTLFGSSDTGLLLTDEAFFAKPPNSETFEINLVDINSVRCKTGLLSHKVYVNNHEMEFVQAGGKAIDAFCKLLECFIDEAKLNLRKSRARIENSSASDSGFNSSTPRSSSIESITDPRTEEALKYCEAGNQEDLEKGVGLLEELAIQGLPCAKFMLGACFLHGLYVEEDEALGAELMADLVQLGFDEPLLPLGLCYANGSGVEKDRQKAIELLEESSKRGESRALFLLAEIYDNDSEIPDAEKKAFYYYTLAVEAGETEALIPLGQAYETGSGTHVDREAAYTFYCKAYEHGVTVGLYKAAKLLYANSESDQDKEKALKMYREVVNSCEELSYSNGGRTALDDIVSHGLDVLASGGDAIDAVQCLIFGASKGDKEAMYYAGLCFYNGMGVDKNIDEAKSLFLQVLNSKEYSSHDRVLVFSSQQMLTIIESHN